MRRRIALVVAFIVAVAILWMWLRPAAAQDYVDLELVIAVDVSGSVNSTEYELQVRGLMAAFRNPEVLDAIEAAGSLGIAVAVLEWADNSKGLAVDWMVVRDKAGAARFANEIKRLLRKVSTFRGGMTATGTAIHDAHRSLDRNAYDGLRRVIDLSGDGKANTGLSTSKARDAAVAADIIINGLAIDTRWQQDGPVVYDFYQQHVVGGPGSFLLKVDDYRNFGVAMAEKLIREMSVPIVMRDTIAEDAPS